MLLTLTCNCESALFIEAINLGGNKNNEVRIGIENTGDAVARQGLHLSGADFFLRATNEEKQNEGSGDPNQDRSAGRCGRHPEAQPCVRGMAGLEKEGTSRTIAFRGCHDSLGSADQGVCGHATSPYLQKQQQLINLSARKGGLPVIKPDHESGGITKKLEVRSGIGNTGRAVAQQSLRFSAADFTFDHNTYGRERIIAVNHPGRNGPEVADLVGSGIADGSGRRGGGFYSKPEKAFNGACSPKGASEGRYTRNGFYSGRHRRYGGSYRVASPARPILDHGFRPGPISEGDGSRKPGFYLLPSGFQLLANLGRYEKGSSLLREDAGLPAQTQENRLYFGLGEAGLAQGSPASRVWQGMATCEIGGSLLPCIDLTGSIEAYPQCNDRNLQGIFGIETQLPGHAEPRNLPRNGSCMDREAGKASASAPRHTSPASLVTFIRHGELEVSHA